MNSITNLYYKSQQLWTYYQNKTIEKINFSFISNRVDLELNIGWQTKIPHLIQLFLQKIVSVIYIILIISFILHFDPPPPLFNVSKLKVLLPAQIIILFFHF